MKQLFLAFALSTVLLSCDRPERPNDHKDIPTRPVQSDNSRINASQSGMSETRADRALTERIRQELMNDESLSTNARNINIITDNGIVTLRGPVSSASEKDAIARKINNISGVVELDNQLEVARNY